MMAMALRCPRPSNSRRSDREDRVIIHSEPFSDYLSSRCYGSGDLKDAETSFELVRRKRAGEIPREDKPAFLFGRAFHCFMLEGEGAYQARFARCGFDRRSKAYKEYVDTMSYMGRETISEEDDLLVRSVAESCRKSQPLVNDLLAAGEAEVTVRQGTDYQVVPVQVRPDWLNVDGCEVSGGKPYVVSLKTCESIDTFQRDIVRYRYYLAEGFYQMVLRDELRNPNVVMYHLACEKKQPYRSRLYRYDQGYLDQGRLRALELLRGIAECERTGVWPNGPTQIQTLYTPERLLERPDLE